MLIANFPDELLDTISKLRAALEAIGDWQKVNLSREYEHGLRDIIQSKTDFAREALIQVDREQQMVRKCTCIRCRAEAVVRNIHPKLDDVKIRAVAEKIVNATRTALPTTGSCRKK
jgi:hypothetical protein